MPSAAFPALTTPDQPEAVTAQAGAGKATVSWVAPVFTGGDPVLGYDIQQSTSPGTWVSESSVFHADPATTETIAPLVNGTTVQFRVAAITAYRSSPYSLPSLRIRLGGDLTGITVGHNSAITVGHPVALQTIVEDATNSERLNNVAVQLESRTDRNSAFHAVATVHTNSTGVASIQLRPVVNTQFEWRMAAYPGHLAGTSAIQSVSVAPAVKAAATKTRVAQGHVVDLFGTVTPNAPGQVVYLERQVGTTWVLTGSHAVITVQRLPNGRRTLGFVIAAPTNKRGATTYRVLRKATRSNVAGTSEATTITVV
jgi:hypothetical protein